MAKTVEMKAGTLQRDTQGDTGTFGVLDFEGEQFQTGELPWRDNTPGMSCIPAGTYLVLPFNSPSHGPCFMIQAVRGRTDCEIHAGNWCGDVRKGYRTDVRGCILVGLGRAVMIGQPAVEYSKDALQRLLALVPPEGFMLTIKDPQ